MSLVFELCIVIHTCEKDQHDTHSSLIIYVN